VTAQTDDQMKIRTETNAESLRGALLGAWQSLRSARNDAVARGVVAGGELAAAEAKYKDLAGRYVTQRLVEGLGPDPELIDRDTFDATVLAAAEPGSFARKIRKQPASCLDRDTMAAMLASGPRLGELLDAAARPADAFDQQARLRQLMRTWAEGTLSDPFVSQCLQDVSERLAGFAGAVGNAVALLNELRMKYELEHRGAERVALARNADGKLELVAANPWAAIEKAFPADADQVYANTAVAELEAGRIEHAAGDINRELARFFAELIPRAFALTSKLPRPQRRERTGGTRLTPARAAALVEAAQATDFVADTGSKLGFARKPLPRRLRMLTSEPRYQRVRRIVEAQKVQDAGTVVVHAPDANALSEPGALK